MKSVLILIVIFLNIQLFAQDTLVSTEKKWYVPRILRVQYAGELGMLSVGPTWLFSKDRLELSYSLGYVPKFAGGENIFVTALKFEYTPTPIFDINIGERIEIRPLSVGIFISHTFGETYNKYRDSKQYPKGYYWWNTVYRIGITYKAELNYSIQSKWIEKIGVYYEVGTLDLYLMSRWDNGNNQVVNLYNTLFMSLGTKIYF